MSSFPQIYKKSHSLDFKPQKQGGIYSIKLLLNSPLHPKSPHSKDKLNLSLNLDNLKQSSKGFASLKKQNKVLLKRASARYSHGAVSLEQKKEGNGEEVGSLATIYKDSTHQLVMMRKILNDDSRILTDLKNDFKKLEQKVQQKLAAITHLYGGKIDNLRKKLSIERKQTGMQTKVNKKQTNNLIEEVDLAKCLIVEMNETSEWVKKQCKA